MYFWTSSKQLQMQQDVLIGYLLDIMMNLFGIERKMHKIGLNLNHLKMKTGIRKYYNRIRMEATDKTPFTTHKIIIKNLDAGNL